MLSFLLYVVTSPVHGQFYVGVVTGALVGVGGFKLLANKIGAAAAARGINL